MCVQIATAHKARLTRVRVYPANHKQFFFITVVEKLLLVQRLARIGRGGLLRHNEPRDEHGVGFQDAAEHATGLKVQARVGGCDGEELLAQLGGEEYRAQGVTIFEVGRGFEGEGV
jgi:hypothetical protein